MTLPSASAGSWAGPRARSRRRRAGCCSRRRTSRPWPSPGAPSDSVCAPRRRPVSNGVVTPRGSTGPPRDCASCSEPRPGSGIATPRVWSTCGGPCPGPVGSRCGRPGSTTCSGASSTTSRWSGYLEPIGFACTPQSTGVVDVTVPTFRPDTGREIDVIEEVARHHGYANLPRRRPFTPQVGRLTPYQRDRRLARQVMAGLGAHEAWTASLLGPDQQSKVGIDGGVRGDESAHTRRERAATEPPARDVGRARVQRRSSSRRGAALRGGPRVPAARARPGGPCPGPLG